MSTDPYATPKAAVADVQPARVPMRFIPGGRRVRAARGGAWVQQAWPIFRRQPGMWVAVTIPLIIAAILIGLIPYAGQLLSALAFPVLWAGVYVGCRDVADGKELEFGHILDGFGARTLALSGIGLLNYSLLVGAHFVAFAMLGVDPLPTLGFSDRPVDHLDMKVVLAGLLALAIYMPLVSLLTFMLPLVAIQQVGYLEALKSSATGFLKNIPALLVNLLVWGILSIPAAIPLGLGLLVLWPMFLIGYYNAFRDIYFEPAASNAGSGSPTQFA